VRIAELLHDKQQRYKYRTIGTEKVLQQLRRSYSPQGNEIIFKQPLESREVGGYRMQRITKFFSEVVREMRKVSWPKRKELTRYTITVLTTVAFFALFFAVLDLGISELIRLILE